MARRTSNKIEPAVQTLFFTGLTVPASGSSEFYLDLSQCASLANRRFYRQGINWAVAGFKMVSGADTRALTSISKLPNTWVLSNSWEKSMRAWLKMSNEALEEAESVRPRFLDFKIYADSSHHNAGFGANLLPHGHEPGEWDASKIYTPNGPNFPGNTNEFEIIAVGPNYPGLGTSGLNAVSMIEGYAASRALPAVDEPNTPADAVDADGSTPENWMSAMFNEGTDQDSEVLNDMRFDNRTNPYPFEGAQIVGSPPGTVYTDTMYPGGANNAVILQQHDREFISSTTIGGTTRFKGGNFPCGLIKIAIVNLTEVEIEPQLYIDLIPGNHRGYLCEPMTEM
ncbi:MAG: hypothetical protein [Circular genetic element sp.]|nr:MAG: hypothetical protein [Circular genetic element sp.]